MFDDDDSTSGSTGTTTTTTNPPTSATTTISAVAPPPTDAVNSTTTATAITEDETEEYLHLYEELTSNVYQDSNDGGKPIILSSLHRLDELLQSNQSVVERLPGHNMNVDTVVTQDGKQFLRCHLATLLDFTHGNNVAYKHAFEAAAGIALAAHHLNEGIGWIVPEVTGLPSRCPVRFTTEFADTEYDQGASLKHVIDMTDREVNKPCAFIGATRSTVSIPTAIVTGIRGYPQISSQSTSEQLDDADQFPLFSRTVPSDVDNAVPIVKFFRNKLNATHLAVLHVNNGYGNAFADDLKLAAQKFTPDLFIEEQELSEHPNAQLITDAIHLIKETQFSYIFAALNDNVIDRVMQEAYKQGVAGNGIHNWFFSNTFGDIDDRYFEKDSVLHKAYRGVGRMEVSGGHTGMRSFDTFACNLRTLRSSPPDLDYLASLLPKKDYQHYDAYAAYAATNHSIPFLYEESFMDPVPKMADRTSPAYEAAIALGLSACDVIANGLPLTGHNHHAALKQTEFMGVESEVRFLNESGTRDPNTTLFAVENEIEEEVLVEIKAPNGTVLERKTMIKFHAVITDIYGNGEWKHLEDYVFSDGTSMVQPDLTPPGEVDHQYIHTPLKVLGALFYVIIMGLAIRCAWWTEHNKNTRVVRASQPLFLRVILGGIMIFASAIVPLNIDDRTASHRGCTIACNFFYWLLFLGFSVLFSGLFTKIYRVNQILNNPVKFKRVKVTVKDVIKPMAAIIGVNLILLIVMTSVAPSQWEIVVTDVDKHGRPTETYGHCTTGDQIPYYATLGVVNFSALLFSIQQAYNTRKLATEFSESRYIFYAMIGILVALFQGIPVLILVRDSPDVQDFIKCTVIFVTCCSVLCFLFVPKMKHLKKLSKRTRSMRINDSVAVSGVNIDQSHTTNRGSATNQAHMDGSNDTYGHLRRRYEAQQQQPQHQPVTISGISGLSNFSGVSATSTASENSSEDSGVRFTTMTHTELQEENKRIRDKLAILNCDLGTLATNSTLSEDSGTSSGMRIIARKSPGELMTENKRLKKTLRKALKKHKLSSAKVSIEEEKESESEGEDDDDDDDEEDLEKGRTYDETTKKFPEGPKPKRQVSFKLPSLRKMESIGSEEDEASTKSTGCSNEDQTESAKPAETRVEHKEANPVMEDKPLFKADEINAEDRANAIAENKPPEIADEKKIENGNDGDEEKSIFEVFEKRRQNRQQQQLQTDVSQQLVATGGPSPV